MSSLTSSDADPARTTAHSSIDLAGVLIPATTPFDPETGDVDVVAFRANVRRWAETGIRGVVVGGSTGEAVFLDARERVLLVEGARGALPDDRLLVAGTGVESTRGTIDLCRRAAERGADAVLVQPPAFYAGQMTSGALFDHYQAVADASPVPVILYQVPLRFGTLDLPTGLVAELANHDNVVGIKDSRGNLELVGELVTQCRDSFQVLVGNGALLYSSLETGAVGGILGVANLAPDDCVAIHDAFVRGRPSVAGRVQERVAPVHREIVGGFGVPGVKKAMDLLGYRGGDPRRPLLPLPHKHEDTVREILEAASLL